MPWAIAVGAREGFHVGHGVGGGAHAKAAVAGGNHGRIAIGSHHLESDKISKKIHESRLHEQDGPKGTAKAATIIGPK